MDQNYFELFNLPPGFDVDLAELEQAYQKIMQQVHPDRQHKQEFQQRLAAQYTALVNDAYDCLKNPVSRAIYLAEQNGIHIDLEQSTIYDEDFLGQLMLWQERLQDLSEDKNTAGLTALDREIRSVLDRQETLFEQAYSALRERDPGQSGQNLAPAITDAVLKMNFLYRFIKRVND